MKRFFAILTILLCAYSVTAQSPRVVLKSITEGDRAKAVERLDKISLKTRNEMPEMCILAEAALLCMPEQDVASKLRGYEMLATHLTAITSSENIEKTFKGSDTSLSDIIRYIEHNSWISVAEHNNEATFREYLELAKRGSHTSLIQIKQQLEDMLYANVLRAQDKELCKAFIEEFPQSKYRADVERHHTKILYNEAMRSTNEELMERFLAEHSDYERAGDVATRLMEHRYKRISRSEDLEQMRWFVDLYPNYRDITNLKQRMANIEYPQLKDSRESLEAFLEYYPSVRQASEARSRLEIFKLIDNANISEIFQYIKRNGYDRNYTRMQRAIAKKHGYILLSNDINTLSLVRFRNLEGKVGYLGLNGQVVVAAQYDLSSDNGVGSANSRRASAFECLAQRGAAVVIKDGKYGVINSSGALIIPTVYENISLLDGEIICVMERRSDGGQWQNATFVCDVFDYKGGQLAKGREYKVGSGSAQYHNWDVTWFSANVSLKDTHNEWEKSIYVDGKFIGTAMGGFHSLTPDYRWFKTSNDDRMHVLSRKGEVTTLTFQSYDIEVIFGNVIMAESISTGNRCVIDLDKRSIISKDRFREMYPMSDDIILVQYTDNSFGYVDRHFTAKSTERYSRAYSYSCATAAVIKGGVGYLIDKQGKQVSSTYDDIAPLAGHSGLYKVVKDGKCGIIDANDDIVIAIEHQPKSTNHYTSDKLSSVQSLGGVIEWSGGVKTLIFKD